MIGAEKTKDSQDFPSIINSAILAAFNNSSDNMNTARYVLDKCTNKNCNYMITLYI